MSGAELHERWMDAYQSAYADPGGVGGLGCPSCGARALRLIFVVRPPDEERGVFTFWCDSCLTGLMPGPAPVPEGASA